MNPVLALLLLVVVAANAQCTSGPPGADATAVVTFDPATQCVTELYTGMSSAVQTCNGSLGATGQDGATIEQDIGVTQLCDVITAGSSKVALCNGEDGPQGFTGLQGIQGPPAPPPNITRILNADNTTSWIASNGTSSVVLRNMTAPRGIQGIQGITGNNGTDGFNGTQGPAGYMGPMPGYLVVAGAVSLCTGGGITTQGFGAICPTFGSQCSCASRYALSRAGIQQAINDGMNTCSAGATQCSAIVTVGGNVVSDGVALVLGSYITLDFNGFTFSAVANASSQDVISATGGALGSSQALTATAAAGNTSVQVASTSGYAVGDMVVLSGGTLNGLAPGSGNTNRAATQTTVVTAVNSATGLITVRDALAWDFMTSLSATIQRVASPLVYGAIRNVIINANGNTGSLTRLLVVERVQYFRLERVVVTGTLSNAFAGSPTLPDDYVHAVAGIQVWYAVDSHFGKLQAKSLVTGSVTARDIALMGLAGSTVRILRSEYSGGPGPAILFSTYTAVSSVFVQSSLSVNFRIGTCAYCAFSGIASTAAGNTTTGMGLAFGFGSHHNTVSGVITTGNQYAGITFQGTLDSYNQIRGFQSLNNRNQSVVFGTANAGAQGNHLSGAIDMAPGGVPMYVFDSNSLEHVNNPNGHILFSVSGQTPTAADFVGNRQMIATVASSLGTDNQLLVNVKGTDGTVRRQSVTSPTNLS
jgi:hypothetical protein